MYAQMYKSTGLWYLIDEKYNLAVGIFLNRESLEKSLKEKKLTDVKILEETD